MYGYRKASYHFIANFIFKTIFYKKKTLLWKRLLTFKWKNFFKYESLSLVCDTRFSLDIIPY